MEYSKSSRTKARHWRAFRRRRTKLLGFLVLAGRRLLRLFGLTLVLDNRRPLRVFLPFILIFLLSEHDRGAVWAMANRDDSEEGQRDDERQLLHTASCHFARTTTSCSCRRAFESVPVFLSSPQQLF